MSPLKTLPQRKFLKGLVATQPKWDQSPGSVPRISNLLMTDRGGLSTCDGSFIISALNGAPVVGGGPWTELFLFQPNNVSRYYIGLIKKGTLGNPNPTAIDNGAGGVLGAGTYRYRVTALDGASGETTAPVETSVTIVANHTIKVTWAAISNAISYNVYRTAAGGAPGTETLQTNILAPTVQFIDDGSIVPGSTILPLVETDQITTFTKIPATSWGVANQIALFPADPFVPVDGTPGGLGGGGGSTGTTSGNPPTPTGGNVGNLSPIPQIIQFANKAVLALGNGFAPQLFTDPSTVAAITNTFTATYPDWNANLTVSVGDLITPTVNNAGGFIFRCTQGGVTSNVNPTFNQTPNGFTAESAHNVQWVNTGATATAPAPRGAAHAEVYAGALWLANTNPVTTADNFDGPTCIKMSDLNNPTSWNPLNVLFLGKDDGDQITGIKAFTIAADGITPTGSLLAFKYFKTFQIIGVFGAADFAVQEAKTDMGCIAPRSIQFLPGFGVVRLTHLGIAIFDGTNDRLISEEIRPYLFSSQDISADILGLDLNLAYLSKGAQSADPPMYMLAIPLALSALPLGTGVGQVNVRRVAGGSTFPSFAVTFIRVTKFTAAGEAFISQETSITLTGAFTLNVGLGAGSTLDTTATKYRVYIGFAQAGGVVVSGQYTNYAELTPAQMLAGVVFTDFSQFPNSGTIVTGTGGLTRILCYDLVLKAWAVIDLPFSISVLKQFRAVGTEPITVCGGFSDGTVRRLQGNDLTWDGTPVSWSMRSGEVYGKLANTRIFYRRLTIRGTTTQANLAINAVINLDGADGVVSPMMVYQLGNVLGTYDFLAQVDIGFTNYAGHVTLSGSGNIEIVSLEWEASSLREGMPPVI